MIYFCEQGAASVRVVLYSPPVAAKGQKAFAQGAALKIEGRRPIVAMAALPMDDSLLLVLTADGMLTGCVCHCISCQALFLLHACTVCCCIVRAMVCKGLSLHYVQALCQRDAEDDDAPLVPGSGGGPRL